MVDETKSPQLLQQPSTGALLLASSTRRCPQRPKATCQSLARRAVCLVAEVVVVLLEIVVYLSKQNDSHEY
eukprot:m.50393 g.50393  ORF g.50393 m.50393 type:complete len:71 (+) comp11159_c0_seq2:148-360(+)